MTLQFHKGMDYAVVMRPNQSTEDALARLYGQDKDVTKFGNMFSASPEMLAALKWALTVIRPGSDLHTDMTAAVAKAEGA